MASKWFTGPTPGIEECEQVLGVQIMSSSAPRSCNYIEQSVDMLINTPADPNRATNDAALMSKAMLDKVKI